jgi:hypothetical protein
MRKSIILLLLLTSCSRILVKDYIYWGDKGIHGATGVHSLCSLEKCPPIFLDKPTWDDKRIGMVCTDFTAMADMQSNIDRLCARHPGECKYEEVANMRRNVRYVLRQQQWAGVKISPNLVYIFAPERDKELKDAMESH